MKVLTTEIQAKLEERRDEIITVAMGKCWHDYKTVEWGYLTCSKCKALFLGNHLSYNFNSPGWFDLFNWLIKERREWWKLFYRWADLLDVYKTFEMSETHAYINENLAQLFVEWLWVTEAGLWEECDYCDGKGYYPHNGMIGIIDSKGQPVIEESLIGRRIPCEDCEEEGKILTPLGKLMKEITK